jgi:hypothetical protein
MGAAVLADQPGERMHLKPCIAGGLCLAMLAALPCASAGQPQEGQGRGADVATAPAGNRAPAADPVARPAAGSDTPPVLERPASAGELEGMRGGAGQSSSATLTGELNGNSATQVATGNNVIQTGSFANAAGLPVVIQNSGANVLIQNATVINLELK